MDYIFENNRKWVQETVAEDPDAFKRLAKSQQPKYLYIGCSDSRVPAQNMMASIYFLPAVEAFCLWAVHEKRNENARCFITSFRWMRTTTSWCAGLALRACGCGVNAAAFLRGIGGLRC